MRPPARGQKEKEREMVIGVAKNGSKYVEVAAGTLVAGDIIHTGKGVTQLVDGLGTIYTRGGQQVQRAYLKPHYGSWTAAVKDLAAQAQPKPRAAAAAAAPRQHQNQSYPTRQPRAARVGQCPICGLTAELQRHDGELSCFNCGA